MNVLRSAAKLAFATADLFLPSPSGPRILIYHQVGAGLGRQMEVTVEDFECQLDWLQANREVVSLETALNVWSEPNSDQLVVLTFDDGYRDTYETAFPILRERGLPFTLYLATRAIEEGSGPVGAEPLDWDHVAKMLESDLVTVGAHTHNHADLRQLAGRALIDELETCDHLIEDQLGIRPEHFAYPWGYWSQQADPLIRQRYSSATVGSPTVGASEEPDSYLIHRYPVQRSDEYMWFTRRLRGGFLLEEVVRKRLRGYRGP